MSDRKLFRNSHFLQYLLPNRLSAPHLSTNLLLHPSYSPTLTPPPTYPATRRKSLDHPLTHRILRLPRCQISSSSGSRHSNHPTAPKPQPFICTTSPFSCVSVLRSNATVPKNRHLIILHFPSHRPFFSSHRPLRSYHHFI